MLKNTFCHIPRVGVKTETRYWNQGVRTWDDMLALDETGRQELRLASIPGILDWVEQSRQELDAGRVDLFAQRLPANQTWRLYDNFLDSTAFVDIETTGMGQGEDHITSIALFDGKDVRTYVHGRNLDDFIEDIFEYDLLVTFNGRCFDVPFMERHFGAKLDLAHLDLRFALKAVGVTGGLKACEKKFGLDRGSLDGVDGYWAVLLWKEYQNTGDERYLETLLAYNIEDVLSLQVLAAHAYNLAVAQTPFSGEYELDVPQLGLNPVIAHGEVISTVRAKYFPG